MRFLLGAMLFAWLEITTPEPPVLPPPSSDGIEIEPNTGCKQRDCIDELVELIEEMIRRGGFGHLDE